MKSINDVLVNITKWIEIMIAIILIIAIVLSGFAMLMSMFDAGKIMGDFQLNAFLKTILTLVVGVEFAKMLILHTPDSVLEVLLYAIARQIVIYHDAAFDNLVGVLAVCVIFAIRKYMSNSNEMENK